MKIQLCLQIRAFCVACPSHQVAPSCGFSLPFCLWGHALEDGGGIRAIGDVDAVNTSLTFNCSILGRPWPHVTMFNIFMFWRWPLFQMGSETFANHEHSLLYSRACINRYWERSDRQWVGADSVKFWQWPRFFPPKHYWMVSVMPCLGWL